MLTEAEKTDARRFCGYPTLGAQAMVTGIDHRLALLTPAEITVLRNYLATLRTLEQAIPSTGEGLDTAQVSVWQRNPNELRDRTKLFDSWRRRLCEFLGITPGPHMVRGGVSFIV